MGAAAVMANTAIATAGDVPAMANAFKLAIEAGRKAYLTGIGRVLARGGSASDPLQDFYVRRQPVSYTHLDVYKRQSSRNSNVFKNMFSGNPFYYSL